MIKSATAYHNYNDTISEMLGLFTDRFSDIFSELVGEKYKLYLKDAIICNYGDNVYLSQALSNKSFSAITTKVSNGFEALSKLYFKYNDVYSIIPHQEGTNLNPELDFVKSNTLLEVGNVYFNFVIAKLLQRINIRAKYSLPRYSEIMVSNLDELFDKKDLDKILFFEFELISSSRKIPIWSCICFDELNFKILAEKLDYYYAHKLGISIN